MVNGRDQDTTRAPFPLTHPDVLPEQPAARQRIDLRSPLHQAWGAACRNLVVHKDGDGGESQPCPECISTALRFWLCPEGDRLAHAEQTAWRAFRDDQYPEQCGAVGLTLPPQTRTTR